MDKKFIDWVTSEASRNGFYKISSEPLMKNVRHVLEAQLIRGTIELSVNIAMTEASIGVLSEEKVIIELKIERQSSWKLCFWISSIYCKIRLWQINSKMSAERIELSMLIERKECLFDVMEAEIHSIEERIKHEMLVAESAQEQRMGNNSQLIGSEFMDNNNGETVSNVKKNNSNGQISESKAGRYLENLDGYEDGYNVVRSINIEEVVPAVRLTATDEKMKVAADYENSKSKIKRSKSDIRKVKAKSSKISNQLKNMRQNVKLAEGILFIIAGIIFVLGEIELSRYLLIKGWQLGNEGILSQVFLVTGIGMASIFLAYVYDRLREKGYINKSKMLRTVVRISVVVSVLLFVFFFLQLGYVRAVIFEYLMLNYETDVYEKLFSEHPYLTPTAFIGISFMFLIGGAVLLSAGMRRLREASTFFSKKKELKVLSRTENKLEKEFESTIKDFNMIMVQYQFYSDESQIESLIKDQTEIHFNKYAAEYERGRKLREKMVKDRIVNRLKAGNNGSSKLSNGSFDITVRRLLDVQLVDNFLNNKECDRDQMSVPK